MVATPDGGGYRFVAADGGIFNFGSAKFFGSAGGSLLPAPIVSMVGTADGNGYWLIGASGAVYNYGDAVALAGSKPGLEPTVVGHGECQAVGFPDGSVATQIAIAGTTCSVATTVLQGSDGARGAAYNADGFACTSTPEGPGSPWSLRLGRHLLRLLLCRRQPAGRLQLGHGLHLLERLRSRPFPIDPEGPTEPAVEGAVRYGVEAP